MHILVKKLFTPKPFKNLPISVDNVNLFQLVAGPFCVEDVEFIEKGNVGLLICLKPNITRYESHVFVILMILPCI